MLSCFFFIGGTIIGSFLNVCIYRMPLSKSVVAPGSHCVHCGHVLAWYENVPLLSFFFLRGKCSACHKRISIRYATVELITGILFAALYRQFGFCPELFIFILMSCGLVLATFIDFDHQLIPDTVSFGGLALGLASSFFFPRIIGCSDGKAGVLQSFYGALAGGASIYLIGALGKVLFKKDAMGFGDVKFLAMIGSFLGWQKILLVFFVAPFFGAAVGIFLKIRYKVETIPYGPYLSLAAIVAIFWGDRLLDLLMHWW